MDDDITPSKGAMETNVILTMNAEQGEPQQSLSMLSVVASAEAMKLKTDDNYSDGCPQPCLFTSEAPDHLSEVNIDTTCVTTVATNDQAEDDAGNKPLLVQIVDSEGNLVDTHQNVVLATDLNGGLISDGNDIAPSSEGSATILDVASVFTQPSTQEQHYVLQTTRRLDPNHNALQQLYNATIQNNSSEDDSEPFTGKIRFLTNYKDATCEYLSTNGTCRSYWIGNGPAPDITSDEVICIVHKKLEMKIYVKHKRTQIRRLKVNGDMVFYITAMYNESIHLSLLQSLYELVNYGALKSRVHTSRRKDRGKKNMTGQMKLFEVKDDGHVKLLENIIEEEPVIDKVPNEVEQQTCPPLQKKPRGRPRKLHKTNVKNKEEGEIEIPKKRGRPKKVRYEVAPNDVKEIRNNDKNPVIFLERKQRQRKFTEAYTSYMKTVKADPDDIDVTLAENEIASDVEEMNDEAEEEKIENGEMEGVNQDDAFDKENRTEEAEVTGRDDQIADEEDETENDIPWKIEGSSVTLTDEWQPESFEGYELDKNDMSVRNCLPKNLCWKYNKDLDAGCIAQALLKTKKIIQKYCPECLNPHIKSKRCIYLNPKSVIPDGSVCKNSSALLLQSLPSELSVGFADGRKIVINAACSIKACKQFGPVIGKLIPEKAITKETDLANIWFLKNTDETDWWYLSTAEEESSNWCRYLTQSVDPRHSNCTLIFKDNQIFIVTTKTIYVSDQLIAFVPYFGSPDRPAASIMANIASCTTCKMDCDSAVGFQKHFHLFHKYGIKNKPSSCSVCGENFPSIITLKQHCTERHDGQGGHLKCDDPNCTMTFFYAHHKRTHIKNVHPAIEDATACQKCGRIFKSVFALKQHNTNVHHDFIFTCTVCEKQFSRKATMLRHQKRHATEPDKACQKCGKTFYDNWSLKIHLASHSTVKAFICEIDSCQQGFSSKKNIIDHYSKSHNMTFPNIPRLVRNAPMIDQPSEDVFEDGEVETNAIEVHQEVTDSSTCLEQVAKMVETIEQSQGSVIDDGQVYSVQFDGKEMLVSRTAEGLVIYEKE